MLPEKLAKSSPVSKVSKVFVAVSIVGIVAIAAYSRIVSPQTAYLHAAQQHEMMLRTAGKKAATIKKKIKTKTPQLAELRKEIGKIQDKFFTSEGGREFFLDIDPISIASDCNVDWRFKDVKPTSDNKHDDSFFIALKRVEISLTGQYRNIIKFLTKLSSYSEHLSISNLSIKSIGFRKKELICKMTITIYLIENKEITTDE